MYVHQSAYKIGTVILILYTIQELSWWIILRDTFVMPATFFVLN